MERKISQFMFCLLDKGSRLFFRYLKRKIHQVTFGKIDLNNSFLQNDINPWSTEDVRTQWMSRKPLNTIFPQDTAKKNGRGFFLPGFIVCLLAWVFPCPFLHSHPRSAIQVWFCACLAQPGPAPGGVTGHWGPRAALPQDCSHPLLQRHLTHPTPACRPKGRNRALTAIRTGDKKPSHGKHEIKGNASPHVCFGWKRGLPPHS